MPKIIMNGSTITTAISKSSILISSRFTSLYGIQPSTECVMPHRILNTLVSHFFYRHHISSEFHQSQYCDRFGHTSQAQALLVAYIFEAFLLVLEEHSQFLSQIQVVLPYEFF